jgi:toxin-antitoxin system PIN domain toxin
MTAIDTNVLVYATNSDSKEHIKAKKLVTEVLEGKIDGVITYQNLTEFYAVVTNKKLFARPLTPKQAIEEIENLISGGIKILNTNRMTAEVWLKLLRQKPVAGQSVHELFLAATLMSNQVTTIITEDKEGFADISGLTVKGLI